MSAQELRAPWTGSKTSIDPLCSPPILTKTTIAQVARTFRCPLLDCLVLHLLDGI